MRGPLAVIMWVALVNGEAHRRITLKDPIVGSVQAKKCKTDRDCIENAFCETNHECYCKLNYVPIEGDDAVTCLREATGFGDACRHHLQCTGRMGTRAECRFNSSGAVVTRGMSTGQCLCQHHAHYAEGICHKTSYLGEKCSSSENCKILSTSMVAYCLHGECVCPGHLRPNPENTDCVPAAGLLESCDKDINCRVPNSVCYGTCQCKVGYVRVSEDRCLQAVDQLEWQCEDNRQCSEYLRQTVCHPVRRRCTCEPGSHPIQGACYYNADLGDACSHPFECFKTEINMTSSNILCHQAKCKCAPNFMQRGDQCIPGGEQMIQPAAIVSIIAISNLMFTAFVQ